MPMTDSSLARHLLWTASVMKVEPTGSSIPVPVPVMNRKKPRDQKPRATAVRARRTCRRAPRRRARCAAPQEPALQQLGVEPVGLGPAMLPRYGDTRGMDHVRFDPARIQPTRQPEAIAAGFESQCNPRDLFTGPDRFIAPAMQQAKKPFRTRFQLLLRLTLNAGKHTA